MRAIYKKTPFLLTLVMLLLSSCDTDLAPGNFIPTVTTGTSSYISVSNATVGLTIVNISAVTEVGVIYSKDELNPTSKTGTKVKALTVQENLFSLGLTGLQPNTNYYYRAYATDGSEYVYGDVSDFTTLALTTPTLNTKTVTNITDSTAFCGGNITSNGGATITSSGVCWSTTANPTTANSITTDGSTSGSFTSIVNGLAPNVTYYVRAYATNSVGTAYGNQQIFNSGTTIASLTTNNVWAFTSGAYSCGGTIISNGGLAISVSGVCWSTIANPTIANSKTTDGSTLGSFSSSITGLSPGLTYYVRAYATNSAGTAYGNQQTFVTGSTVPTLTTSNVTSVTSTTATCGGTITSDGGLTIMANGVCWSTTENPTTTNSKTTDSSIAGSFTSFITGLSPGTTYYVRAYASNSVGTVYGNQQKITTSTTIASLTTSSVTSITATTATSGGTISSNGGGTITVSGICWSNTSNPTTANSKTTNGSTSGSFTSSITGLSTGATYYVRAYATNSVGTAYGSQQTFTTSSTIASLTTSSVTSIATTSATCGGTITSNGGAPISVSGICWSTSATPTIANSITTDGSISGSFISSLTGLLSGTTYYVRAYATNSVGTAYGSPVGFTTLTSTISLPTVTTNAISGITSTSATGGGNVTSDGGATVTVKGVCWSTSSNPIYGYDASNYGGTGTGAFSCSLPALKNNTTYYVRAYATNSVGAAYGNQVSFTLSSSTGTVTDMDGNVYHTVTIGAQTWMVENLKTTKYKDGASIPLVSDGSAWEALSTPGYCFYNNDAANKNTYGALYNWYTVNTGKLAPTGWHVPTDAEWTTLENYLISNGYNYDGSTTRNDIAKSLAATTLWDTYTTVGTIGNDLTKNNSSGFAGLPGGYRVYAGPFYSIGSEGNWWSSTQYSAGSYYARYIRLYFNASNLGGGSTDMQYGFSVRCVKD